MLELCDSILWEIGKYQNAHKLAKESYLVIRKSGLQEYFIQISGIKAITIEAEKYKQAKKESRREQNKRKTK